MKMGLDLSIMSHCKLRKIVYSFRTRIYYMERSDMEACSSESTASASEIFYIYVRTRSYYSCLENDRRRQYYCSNSSLLNKQRSIRAAAVA